VDHLQTGLNGNGVIGGAILPQQVLKDEDRTLAPTFTLRTKSCERLCPQIRKLLFDLLRHCLSSHRNSDIHRQWTFQFLPRGRHRAVDSTVFWETSSDSITVTYSFNFACRYPSILQLHLAVASSKPVRGAHGAKRTSCWTALRAHFGRLESKQA